MKNLNLLIVDDESMVVDSLKRLFRKQPFTVFCANSAKDGMEIFSKHDIGVVVSDLQMPETDGLSFFEEIRKNNSNVIQILMSGNATLDSALAAINRLQLFRCITKPWNDDEFINSVQNAFDVYNMKAEHQNLLQLIEKQNLDLKEMNTELEKRVKLRTLKLEEAIHEGVLMLANAAEVKDKYTGDHIYRILYLTYDICREMGLSSEEAFKISSFSMIHDVGKLQIPDAILNKPASLDDNEWEIMKTHSEAGEKILGNKPFYKMAREIARSHHENWDGSGYPDGLIGKEIPLPARIVAVADVFDALMHERPYKEAFSFEKTINKMKSMSGKKFQPAIFNAFLAMSTKRKIWEPLNDDKYKQTYDSFSR